MKEINTIQQVQKIKGYNTHSSCCLDLNNQNQNKKEQRRDFFVKRKKYFHISIHTYGRMLQTSFRNNKE